MDVAAVHPRYGGVTPTDILDRRGRAAPRSKCESHVRNRLGVRPIEAPGASVDRHLLTAEHDLGGCLERDVDLVAFVCREGAGGTGERHCENHYGGSSAATVHPVQSVYVRSEHTIRELPGPDSDLEGASPFEVQILRHHRLRRALRCDINHQAARAKHMPQRLRPRMQQLFGRGLPIRVARSEEHTSELQSPCNLVCRLLLEKKK